jgi:hypothetical protein
MLILDALFKYNPPLGSQVLSNVRYTTRTELEETAYDNKNRRLQMHGFVDYYDAMSIYATPPADKPNWRPIARTLLKRSGQENPGNLPAVFGIPYRRSVFDGVTEQITDPTEGPVCTGINRARQSDPVGEPGQSGELKVFARHSKRCGFLTVWAGVLHGRVDHP